MPAYATEAAVADAISLDHATSRNPSLPSLAVRVKPFQKVRETVRGWGR